MGPDARAVDVMLIPVEFTSSMGFCDQRVEQQIPDALLIPALEAAFDGLPGSVALR